MKAKIKCTGCKQIYYSKVHEDYIFSPRDKYWAIDVPCENTEACLDAEQSILLIEENWEPVGELK